MDQRAVVKFCVKLKKISTTTFEMMVKNVYQEQVCLNGTMNSKLRK